MAIVRYAVLDELRTKGKKKHTDPQIESLFDIADLLFAPNKIVKSSNACSQHADIL